MKKKQIIESSKKERIFLSQNKRYLMSLDYDMLHTQKLGFSSFEDIFLKKLFDDIQPIHDIAGERLVLEMSNVKINKPDIRTQADLDRAIEQHKKKETTYGGIITCDIVLRDKPTNNILFETTANVGTMPLLTKSGSYIINGVENTIFSQIIRSYGIIYSFSKKDFSYSFKIVPESGSWIEITAEKKGLVSCRISKSRKFPITALLRVLGLESDDVLTTAFESNFGEEDLNFLKTTIKKDSSYDAESAAMMIYSKLRPGEPVDATSAIAYIQSIISEERMFLGKIARSKINSKLSIANKNNQYLDLEDLIHAISYLFNLANSKKGYHIDDTDHLANKRIRTMGELLYSHLQPTMKKLKKAIKLKLSIVNMEQRVDLKHFFKKTNTSDIIDISTTDSDDDVSHDEDYEYNLDGDSNDYYTDTELSAKKQEKLKNLIGSMVVESISVEEENSKGKLVTKDIIKKGVQLTSSHIKLLEKYKIDYIVIRPNIRLVDIVNFKMLDNQIKTFFAVSELSNYTDQYNVLSELAVKRKITAMGPGGLRRQTAKFDVRDVHISQYGRICPVETPEGPNIGLVINQALYSKINDNGFLMTPAIKVMQYANLIESDLLDKVTDEDMFDKNGKIIIEDKNYITSDIAKKLIVAYKDKKFIKVRPYLDYSNIEYLSPEFDHKYVVGEANIPVDEFGNLGILTTKDNTILDSTSILPARMYTEIGYYHINSFTHVDFVASQVFSPSVSVVPFAHHDDPTRIQMAANMQRQAVPIIKPQAPFIGTGLESKIIKNTSGIIFAEGKGEVVYVGGRSKQTVNDIYEGLDYVIKVKYENSNIGEKGFKEYNLSKFIRSNSKTIIHHTPKISLGQKVDVGTILAEGASIVDGELSLGKDLRIAIMSWKGYNYDDAIVISNRLIKDDELTSIYIDQYEIEVADTKLGPEELTNDIPGVSLSKLSNLDENGIVRIGSIVKSGDILVGKITPKSDGELTAEEKLIQAVFGDKSKNVKDTSLYLPSGSQGKILDVVVLDSKKGDVLSAGVKYKVKVYIASTRKVEIGDKLVGRHGNKGIVAAVLPEEDMPFSDDGTPVDIILNPLGIIGRMNIGQCLEAHLGLVAKYLGVKFAVPLFSGFGLNNIFQMLKDNNLPENGKMILYDGKTGQAFDRPVTVGYMHILKLYHMVDDKIHARNVGPYSLITLQPLAGKSRDGGQRFGEMEVWALEAYGAVNTLQEMLTIKSDDVIGRNKTYESIVKGGSIKISNVPESFNYIIYLFRGLCQNITVLNREQIEKINELRIKKISKLGLRGVTGLITTENSEYADDFSSISIAEQKDMEKETMMQNIIEDMEEFGILDE